MSAVTGIEWTDRTWNPVTGCMKVSPGCAHCYADGVAERFWATQYPGIPILDPNKPEMVGGKPNSTRPRQFTDVMTHEDRLLEPLSWRKPAKVFVNSMSDLFHEDVPDAFIDRVFAVMALAERHTFQVLTKRPERMRAYVGAEDVVERVETHLWNMHTDDTTNAISKWPLKNVWLGVSVESPPYLKRINELLRTPAATYFVSLEPLLADLGDISHFLRPTRWHDLGVDRPALDWVIVGGESGPGARPFDLAWARSIVAQCQAAGVPVFVKQVGADPFDGSKQSCEASACVVHDYARLKLKDRKGGTPDEWPEPFPREFPA